MGITEPHQPGLFIYFFIDFIYLFSERGEGREKVKERVISISMYKENHPSVASCTPPTGDLAHNTGVCPDWELNWRPFDLQVGAQSTEPDQPGLPFIL